MKTIHSLFVRAASLFWFGAAVGFLLLMGEVIDEVRHGHENLFVGFLIPFWGFGTLLSTLVSRAMRIVLPALSRHSDSRARDNWSVIGAVGLALTLGVIWGKSPLFVHFYDSIKFILTLQIVGLLLGFLFRAGGWRSVLSSLFFALIAAVAAAIGLLAIMYFTTPSNAPNVSEVARGFVAVGVPLAISMALFDSLLFFQAAPDAISISMSAR